MFYYVTAYASSVLFPCFKFLPGMLSAIKNATQNL